MSMKYAAIVGCGGIAAVHAAVLGSMANVTLTACADIKPEKAKAFAEKNGLRAYTSLEDMLAHEKLDVLHICTPHALHTPMAELAAQRGIAVFTEKPPVTDLDQWQRLTEARQRVPIGVCFQNRYNPPVQHARQLLASGETGRVLGARAFVTWNRQAPYYTESGWRGQWASEGGGALINQSIHTLDLLVYLLGAPTGVKAAMHNRHLQGVIEVEDTVDARIDFGGAAALFYATTGYCTDAPIFVEIACEKATLRIGVDTLHILWRNGRDEAITFEKAETLGKGYWGNGHLACISDFYDCLETGRPFMNDLSTVESTVKLMLEMYRQGRETLHS